MMPMPIIMYHPPVPQPPAMLTIGWCRYCGHPAEQIMRCVYGSSLAICHRYACMQHAAAQLGDGFGRWALTPDAIDGYRRLTPAIERARAAASPTANPDPSHRAYSKGASATLTPHA